MAKKKFLFYFKRSHTLAFDNNVIGNRETKR